MGWDEVQRQMDLFEREIMPEFQGVGGVVGHAEMEGRRRHEEVIAALEKCTYYTMDCNVGLFTKAKVDTKGKPPLTVDLSFKNGGEVTVHKKR